MADVSAGTDLVPHDPSIPPEGVDPARWMQDKHGVWRDFTSKGYVEKPASGIPASGIPARKDWTPEELAQAMAKAKLTGAMRRFKQKASQDAFNEGYASATREFAPVLLLLQQKVVLRALADDATEGERRLGLQAAKEITERVGGKAKQTITHERPEEDADVISSWGERRELSDEEVFSMVEDGELDDDE